ncbi:MAG: hypothetical protein COT74_04695 [Bdellovibrionales bacterium CG10_big_fil_rev_8_21_14_0_10_45_34]|nr:MAG: hypothetical protein COT74_04695 [Bdellovibrionales bacterium CG10_big_fil_rev_8_21_14_0_10_45_34]
MKKRTYTVLGLLLMSVSLPASDTQLESVKVGAALYATVESQEAFEDSKIVWLPVEQYDRSAKGQFVIKTDESINLGPISIKLKDNILTISYRGNLSAETELTLTAPTGCNRTCRQEVEFGTSDGDYPVGGKLNIEYISRR